jgi:hypothetical protein
MDMDFEWERGNTPDDMQRALRAFADAVERELLEEFEPMMEDIRETVQDNAPVDTGRLRESYSEMVQTIKDGIQGKVQTEVPYAPFQEFLEYGTPHLGPAFEEAKPILEAHVEAAWNRAVRRVS